MELETGSGDGILHALWTYRLVAFHVSFVGLFYIFCIYYTVWLWVRVYSSSCFIFGVKFYLWSAFTHPRCQDWSENSNAQSNILIIPKEYEEKNTHVTYFFLFSITAFIPLCNNKECLDWRPMPLSAPRSKKGVRRPGLWRDFIAGNCILTQLKE